MVSESFSTFNQARNSCRDDLRCNGIIDVQCDDFLFWKCNGYLKKENIHDEYPDTCAWEKGIMIKYYNDSARGTKKFF